MAKNYLGIDLGTTESTVSVIEMENRRDKPMEKLRTLDIYQYNKQHQLDKNLKGLQSSIYIDRKNKVVYTGEYAKELYSSGNMPLNTIRSIKTRIGGESMIEVPFNSNGFIDKLSSMFKSSDNSKSYNMTELSATLLKTIKNSMDKQCSGGIEEVTITIPAGFDSKGGTWSGVLEGLKAERTIYIRNPKDDEENANDLLILKGGKAVDMNGDIIESNQTNETPLDEKIQEVIKGRALSAKQIKEKINYDIDTRKFSLYLSGLSFVKKEKKGSVNMFLYKSESTQLSLFDTN